MGVINEWFKNLLSEREPNKELPNEAYDKFGKELDVEIVSGHTERGFSFNEFTDRYGIKCSLQKSSLAGEDAIWFGVDDVEPKIMSNDAIKLGLREKTFDERDFGWIDYHIPKQVLLHSRMHLTQEHVKQLLPILQKFAETGELE